MKDNFDLYSWNKNRYLNIENKSKENKEKDFDLREWNKKRYLGELDINTMGGETNVDNVDVTHGGDDPKIGAEEESDSNVVGENQSHLEFLAKYLEKMHPELTWEVRFGERIDAYGSQRDLFDFGNKYHGKKFGDYEVFHVDDDDRLDIVRIVKSSKLRGGIKEGVVKDMHTFLNDLRDSGVTNMFGAAPYLQKEFGIDQKSAREVLANWMQSFSENLQYKDRKLSHEEEDRLDLIAHREFDGVSFSKLSDEDKAKVFAKRDKVGVKESITETIKFIKENNPEFTTEEIATELREIKESGKQLNEKLCKKGEAYRKRRMAAGEKSSAYLSGRAVKVCKGQMSGKKKKK